MTVAAGDVELVWGAACLLGEGPVWSAADASLYFVDIKGCEVLAYTPASDTRRRWSMPDWIGWLQPWREGVWVAGLRGGVVALQLEPAVRVEWLWRLHDEASPMRLNDAKTDPAGRLWFGTMHDGDVENRDGLMCCVDGGAEPVVVDRGYRIANGPAFSPDGRTLWHADSAERCVYAFDVDAGGAVSHKRDWLRVEGPVERDGYPDGMTVDARGHLWLARWGAGCVTEHDADGSERRRFHIPATQSSSVAFGGDGLRDLYITSARIGLNGPQLGRQPLAGGLFRIRGVGPGLSPTPWRRGPVEGLYS